MNRWESRFGTFINEFGISPLAQALDIHRTSIFHWMSGDTQPKPQHACAMQILASERGFSLSLDDIYSGPRQVLAEACSQPTTDVPAAVASLLRKNPQCR